MMANIYINVYIPGPMAYFRPPGPPPPPGITAPRTPPDPPGPPGLVRQGGPGGQKYAIYAYQCNIDV